MCLPRNWKTLSYNLILLIVYALLEVTFEVTWKVSLKGLHIYASYYMKYIMNVKCALSVDCCNHIATSIMHNLLADTYTCGGPNNTVLLGMSKQVSMLKMIH